MASETKVAAPFNFGPVSSRDKVLFTSERPGNTSIEKTNIADPAQVQDWLDFMTNQGVTYVIALLDENEYTDCYAAPGLFDAYRKAGLEAMVQPMNDPDASRNIFQAIRRTMESDNGKVVVHCTGGTGRAGRVAAGWLVDQYGLSASEATEEVLMQAANVNMKRKGNVEQLESWLKN